MLKLSGEALMGDKEFGIDLNTINSITEQIAYVFKKGLKISIVVGGGNIFRGISASSAGMDRSSADYTGMMATVINSLVLQNSIERKGIDTRVLSALKIENVCETYIRRRAMRHIEKNRIVIFAAGTGNPFFTTDTAAALRAIEMGCDLLMKATSVDGVYDKDPKLFDDAKRFETISYSKVLSENLKVMDGSAISLSRDNNLPIVVFSIKSADEMFKLFTGNSKYTLIKEDS